MKKTNLYIPGLLLMVGLAACNGTTTSSTQSTTNGDSATMTTTTNTTSTIHRPYRGSFVPQANTKYIDLRTQKQITVRIDTVRGTLVNDETNEPEDLFVDPVKHDTIYGQTGTVVNNYITHDDGGYRVDTVRVHDTVTVNNPDNSTDNNTQTADQTGKYKEKDKNNKEKIKTDDERIKEKKNKVKVTEQ